MWEPVRGGIKFEPGRFDTKFKAMHLVILIIRDFNELNPDKKHRSYVLNVRGLP
jgi:hypothetical protein